MKNELYSFVIPAYNEEENIPLIYPKLLDVMKNISQNFEIIFINDGSKDKTLEKLTELAQKDKRVKFIDLSRNFGHQAALTAGYEHAKGDAIISLDCDLQDPPEVIVKMIEKWKEGFDIVYARRAKRNDKLFKKYTAIFYYKVLYQFSDVKIPRDVGDFRLINRKVLETLNHMPEKSKYIRGMVAWVGFKHTFVDFERPERIHGETNYTLKKMILLSMDGLINFSTLPLKFGFLLGGLSITTGTLFLIYMIFDTLILGAMYPLYKWLVVFLFIFLGFNFVLIWLLGEYIGRIYKESKNRPYYIVNEKINFDENIDA